MSKTKIECQSARLKLIPLIGLARYEDEHGDKETAAILIEAMDTAFALLDEVEGRRLLDGRTWNEEVG